MRVAIRSVCVILTVVCVLLWSVLLWLAGWLPGRFYVVEGSPLRVSRWVSADSDAALPVQKTMVRAGDSYTTDLELFGAIPIKKATVQVVDLPVVTVCGTPFGIKMYTNGALVVGLAEVETDSGDRSPARDAGIQEGDILLAINGAAIRTTGDVARAVERSGGKSLTVRIRRDTLEFEAVITPQFSCHDRVWKAGMWVRDSAAGIGTMTFYDPVTGVFAGLGHAVCDADTGDVLSLASGEAVHARIYNVRKGTAGNPGELLGGFDLGSLGTLARNGETGVYGRSDAAPATYATLPVAMKQEVHTGAVQILTTVAGGSPALYDAVIEQIRLQPSVGTRNMVVAITDPTLLNKTGGIVQGMSGSPILQDGKLIGAVTHVFVNDPTRGYAIFAETMLATAQAVADADSLQAAS